MTTTIVGISAFYHDSAAAVIRDGDILCAAQEERFTRRKHDSGFPAMALAHCLAQAQVRSLTDITAVVYYEKPLIKLERLLETYINRSPRGFRSFVRFMPAWFRQKLMMRKMLEDELRMVLGDWHSPMPQLLFNDHHGSHAAAAFFPGPFQEAAVLCLDGVGEWESSTAWVGRGNTLEPLWRLSFPHSLGLLYSAFTGFCGFRVNSGEYKLMGLAPYGRPIYQELIESKLIEIRPDGSFRLNMHYFDYETGLRMTNRRFEQLFNGPPRRPEAPLGQREMDLAASIQAVTEKIVLRCARHLREQTGLRHLCLGGGVALNCVANGALQRAGIFDGIWVQPSPGDAGSAIGCALSAWHEFFGKSRMANGTDKMHGGYLGPEWSQSEITAHLDRLGARYHIHPDAELFPLTAELLADGKVVAWFQGRMEFGPRALGARSILGDPRLPHMQRHMNMKIKFRESFRPFAPSVMAEHAATWFDNNSDSPYMMTVCNVSAAQLTPPSLQPASGLGAINELRSTIPAVTHVDNSARLHTVTATANPRFYRLLSAFYQRTGVPVLINTSFNVRGEPVVCTPEDAWRCFMGSDIDVLVIGNSILHKAEQPTAALLRTHAANYSGAD